MTFVLSGQISCVLSVGLTCFAISMPVSADVPTTDGVTAQALFDQAKQLAREGRYVQACPKFEESQRLDPGSGTLINLADCYENVGRSASAWNTFLEASAAAEATGNAERASAARERAALLEPTLAKITIDVAASESTPSLTIRRDGVIVGQAQWAVAIPVDEGTHEVIATSPGKKDWSTVVTVRGRGQVMRVDVPLLVDLPKTLAVAEPKPVTSTIELTPIVGASQPAAERANGLSAQRTAAIVAASLGIVGVSLGAAFGLQSKSARDEAHGYCRGVECWDEKGVSLKADAITAGNLSTVMFVIGAAGLTGGAVLWFSEPTQTSQMTRIGAGIGSANFRVAW